MAAKKKTIAKKAPKKALPPSAAEQMKPALDVVVAALVAAGAKASEPVVPNNRIAFLEVTLPGSDKPLRVTIQRPS